MMKSFSGGFSWSFLLVGLLECTGCARGTNSGPAGSGACPVNYCEDPVQVIASDGAIYRGRVVPDVPGIDGNQQSLSNAGVVELSLVGGEVSLSDAGCQSQERRLKAQVFISTNDASIDASGTLHVHGASRDNGLVATTTTWMAGEPANTNDPTVSGWTVDLTLTADGQLDATFSLDSSSWDAAATVGAELSAQELTFSGRIQPGCGLSMSVSGGGTFKFPCWELTGCG
jgi:hypothetical protein